jgi:hypothetical protein
MTMDYEIFCYIYVCMYVCMYEGDEEDMHLPWLTLRNQKTTLQSRLSSSTMWAKGMELRSSGLAESSITH